MALIKINDSDELVSKNIHQLIWSEFTGGWSDRRDVDDQKPILLRYLGESKPVIWSWVRYQKQSPIADANIFVSRPLTQILIGICKSTNFDSSNQSKVSLEQCPYFEK